MAQKRMFDKRVIDNDGFLEMPLTTQAIYFHLNMRADDDGFVDNYKSILRIVGGKEDDLKVLILKKFIIPFENGVIVIKHWRINNLLRKDRYIKTIHQKEKNELTLEENGEYSLGIPSGNQVATQYSKVEESIEEESIVVDDNIENLNYIEGETPATTKNLYDFLEKALGRTLNEFEYEVINTWEDTELTRYAVKQAVLARAFSIKYIDRILGTYKSENIKTVAEAEEREKRFQESKTTKKRNKIDEEDYLERRMREEAEKEIDRNRKFEDSK